MQLTRYVRLLNNFNAVKQNSRLLHRKIFRVQINKMNVSLTTDFPRNNEKYIGYFCNSKNLYSTNNKLVDKITYEKVCDETLESLCEYFEELIENSPHLRSADVNYGDGVLTVNFGNPYGTYVINRQSPNRQIWLSSPKSGPKRYDFVINGQYWLYRHDNITLHELLQSEIKDIVKSEVDFSKCCYSLLQNKK